MKTNLLLICLAASLLFAGCGSSRDFNDISGQQGGNINVPNAPVAQNRNYNTNSNTQLVVNAANGVLAGINQTAVVAIFPTTTSQNGTVAGNPDGSFTYTPPVNFTGPDTFSFTAQNNSGQAQATVTITVAAVNGFFVDAATGNDGTGSFNNGLPFASIQAAVNAASDNATIVVRPGNYGAVTLKNGQRLLGSGSTLITAQGTTRPVLSGPVVLADGNTLDFLRIAGTNGDAVDGNGQNGGTITNCEFANTTAGTGSGTAIRAGDCRGTWTASNNTFSNLVGAGVFFQTLNANTATYIVNNNTASNNGLSGLIFVSDGTSIAKAQVHGNTFSGNSTVQGDAFEAQVLGDSTFGLDLEDNINDGTYLLFLNPFGMATFNVEQLPVLTTQKPNGAGNTGTVDDTTGDPPTNIPDGTLFPN